MEQTLIIVKPDAVRRNLVGEVLGRFEKQGLKIVALKMLHLSKVEAEKFYYVHFQRPFFGSLTAFMASAPIVAAVLEGENAVSKARRIMGATNPAQAEPGTIRKDLAISLEENSVHGSDSPESAAFEIPFFFSRLERCC
ncbi:MAG: nucleoside-diphosphate kinase [Candidatus Schekmanbacteria bacterium]|nr:nucleoside-diphosphate kinase [Candidatus Schekmanbacteria bacterium]